MTTWSRPLTPQRRKLPPRGKCSPGPAAPRASLDHIHRLGQREAGSQHYRQYWHHLVKTRVGQDQAPTNSHVGGGAFMPCWWCFTVGVCQLLKEAEASLKLRTILWGGRQDGGNTAKIHLRLERFSQSINGTTSQNQFFLKSCSLYLGGEGTMCE